MSAIKLETQTIETVYITMHGLEKKVRVSNPDNIPNLSRVLRKKYPAVLLAGWDHTIDKLFTKKSPTEFHVSWLNPTDKGGMAMFLCEQTDPKFKSLTPCYALVYYSKGDRDTNESIIEIKKVYKPTASRGSKENQMKNKGALSKDGGPEDYVLNEGFDRVWITVGTVSVCLTKTDEGVVVDLYEKGNELSESVASTYAFFNESGLQ